MSAPVFLAGPGALDGYRPGDSYPLAGAEGRHAGVVQRRTVGAILDVVDGRGVGIADRELDLFRDAERC